MAARASMASLITATRLLIYDPAGGSQVFSDQEIQDALDHYRQDVRYLDLTAAETIATGGAVSYLDFYAPLGDWEDDVVLQSGATWATLTPATEDLLTGHWTLSADPLATVYATGKVYDRYAAAAELCEDWIARLKLEYDFGSNEQKFARSQRIQALEGMIARFHKRRRPMTVQLTRSDTC